jgi:uncharacterized protein
VSERGGVKLDMEGSVRILLPVDMIAAWCVRRLAFFGSVLREDFSPTSDVDVLVAFLPGKGPSLLGFAGMQMELSEMLGREVHLHTPAMLSSRWRARVEREARVQYAA